MKITVTQEHINRGIVKSAYQCPIAQALQAKKKRSVIVGPDQFSFLGNDPLQPWVNVIHYTLPKVAQKFISAFDSGIPVQPIEFTARKMK